MVNCATRSDGALSHLRVLDLTQFLAGPYCTQILADLGAEVIKVESPKGDITRNLPPHFVAGESAYYLSINRNKRSMAVDLKNPAGRQLVEELAMRADVLVENFRPGVLERLGLGYESLAEKHPGLVWCAISGFGQDGPYRDRPAYDMIVQALSGGMSMTGQPDGPPVRSGIPLGDLGAGMFGAIGVLAALEERRESGQGQYVDISMLDCQVSMLSYQGVYHLVSGTVPGRQGRAHDSIPTYRSFTARDGADVVITANTEKMWLSLCEVLGNPDLADDARFYTNSGRYESRFELWEILEAVFRERDAEEWVSLLQAASIPAAVVNTVDRTLSDPQVLHREMVVEVEDEGGERARLLGNPIKLSRSSKTGHSFPPHLGQDSWDVISDLFGLSDNEVDEMAASGAIPERKVYAE